MPFFFLPFFFFFSNHAKIPSWIILTFLLCLSSSFSPSFSPFSFYSFSSVSSSPFFSPRIKNPGRGGAPKSQISLHVKSWPFDILFRFSTCVDIK